LVERAAQVSKAIGEARFPRRWAWYASRRDASTVEACRESGLSPAAVVEIISWLSVLQMRHRLTCYLTVGE
jgi:hypothetical protein